MAREIIRNRAGKQIAVLITGPDGIVQCNDALGRLKGRILRPDIMGRQEIRNVQGKKLGTYDPKRDVTYDAMNRQIGKGNLALSLLGLV